MANYEAGLELDALIAERVMGAQLIDYTWYDGTRKPFLWWPDSDPPRGDDFQRLPNGWLCEWNSIPPYSTIITAAWEVVTRITATDGPYAESKWSFGLEYSNVVDWVADFTPRRHHPRARDYEAFRHSALTAPLAICRAALAALDKP